VHDEWFADEEHVRQLVGLPEKHIELPKDKEVCPCLRSSNCLFSCLCLHLHLHIFPHSKGHNNSWG
jgi:hypothetical protein